jgi:hypothetical protein
MQRLARVAIVGRPGSGHVSGLHAQHHVLQPPAQGQAVASQDLRVLFLQDGTRKQQSCLWLQGR